jgi:hypothetical protein
VNVTRRCADTVQTAARRHRLDEIKAGKKAVPAAGDAMFAGLQVCPARQVSLRHLPKIR